MSDPIELFRDAMRKSGLDCTGEIIADGKIHRFSGCGNKDTCCWYKLYPDEPIAGAFGCWRGVETETWCAKKEGGYSAIEQEAIRRKWKEAAAERERERVERQAEVRKLAQEKYQKSKPVESHPYLTRKGIKPHPDIRESDSVLVIPIRDVHGTLHSLQFIANENRFGGNTNPRDKDFLWGGKIDGCFFTVAKNADGPIAIAEGVATGLSIYEATGLSTVAALNCGNLLAVAKAIREKYPEREMVICADNDQWTEKPVKNPGLTKATECAAAVNAKLAVPLFEDDTEKLTDFNDLASRQGLKAVKEQISRANYVLAEGDPAHNGGPPDELEINYGKALFVHENLVTGINERYFAAHFYHSRHLLFEGGEKEFYEYSKETGLWKKVTKDYIRDSIANHLLEYGRKLGKSLESKITSNRLEAITAHLRGIAEKHSVFDGARDFVHVLNGVIRFLPNGEVEKSSFSPEDYSRNRCPIAYEENARCPLFEQRLLKQSLPEDDVLLLQKLFGLALSGDNPAQRFAVLDGLAGTGKSTIINIINRIVGTDNTTQLRTEQLNSRFETFRYIGRTLLFASDVPGDFLNRPGASRLKSLVGGDPLDAEAKGSNSVFTLSGKFNVFITSNSRLTIRLDGDEGAWRRRLVIIRFERRLSQTRIPNFADKLIAEEGSGILIWALSGYIKAKRDIMETGDIQLSERQHSIVDALLSESNSLQRFIEERTEPCDSNDVAVAELTEDYFKFCVEMDWSPISTKAAEQLLPDLILQKYGVSKSNSLKRHGKYVRGWRGIRLKHSTEALDEIEQEMTEVSHGNG